MAKTGRDSFKFMLRLPDELRDSLRDVSAANGRSVTAEIIDRLEQSFEVWPRVSIPAHMAKRGMAASPALQFEYEEQLDAFAEQLFQRIFPDLDEYISQIDDILLQAIRDKGADNEDELREEYFDFVVPFLKKLGYDRERVAPGDMPGELLRAMRRGYSAGVSRRDEVNPFAKADDRHSVWEEGFAHGRRDATSDPQPDKD